MALDIGLITLGPDITEMYQWYGIVYVMSGYCLLQLMSFLKVTVPLGSSCYDWLSLFVIGVALWKESDLAKSRASN